MFDIENVLDANLGAKDASAALAAIRCFCRAAGMTGRDEGVAVVASPCRRPTKWMPTWGGLRTRRVQAARNPADQALLGAAGSSCLTGRFGGS